MQRYCDEHELALRPHIKTHKLPRLAQLQVDAGARGITWQKLGEAEVMADAGLDNILLSFRSSAPPRQSGLRRWPDAYASAVVGDSEVAARSWSDTGSDECQRALPVASGRHRFGPESAGVSQELSRATPKPPR